MSLADVAFVPAIVAFVVAWITAKVIVATKAWHGCLSMDSSDGIQKVHKAPTPRIGGISIFAGSLAALPLLQGEALRLMLVILACGAFAFGGGLVEDLTKKVSPRMRLLLALVSGLLFTTFSGTLIPLSEPLAPDGAGEWVEWFTMGMGIFGITVGLAGTTNALNIIDGFHGLASGSMVIMSLAIAFLAHGEGDTALAGVAIVFACVILGFMMMNFPGGFLFLGDAGAYLGGFFIGAMAVFLAARTDISAFVTILVMAHPIYETLFSMMRKSKRKGHSPMQPDGVHLHQLVSRRYARFIAYGLDRPNIRNPLTGALMWPFSIIAAVLAVFAQGEHIGGILGLLIFAVFYGRIYKLASLRAKSFMDPLAKKWGWDEAERYRKHSDPAISADGSQEMHRV